jgi:succinate-semialdehyde dehydrogenase/glutarate-semialdehyde dehydrogenase
MANIAKKMEAAPKAVQQKALIGGRWCGAEDGRTFAVHNPATGEVVGFVPDMGMADIQRAITSAETAFHLWKQYTIKQRSQMLRRWYDLIIQHKDSLAALLTDEQGKPLREAKAEVEYAASYVEWYAEEAKRAYGETLPTLRGDQHAMTMRQPVGVVAAITPWNFPAAMVTRKAAAAIAAGCPVILKPASETPLTALGLAYLAQEAGLPDSVLNVVTTQEPSLFARMVADSDVVQKISFTGSSRVGRELMQLCAPSVKKLVMELGGNAPFIVFDDARLDVAIQAVMHAKFRNAGQACIAANRILVQEGIHRTFMKQLKHEIEGLIVGVGTHPDVTMGPLIHQNAVKRVAELVVDASQKGAVLELGGKKHVLGHSFYEPTLLSKVPPSAAVFSEEIFGPVAAVTSFEFEDEAIALANATPYGLAAYVHSSDVNRCWRMAQNLDCGMVAVNEGQLSSELTVFGGMKQSGFGREGGHHGLEEFLETKYVMFGGISNI